VANARSISVESRLVAPADGTLNFAGVYAGGSLQQVMHADKVPKFRLQCTPGQVRAGLDESRLTGLQIPLYVSYAGRLKGTVQRDGSGRN
jgi:hypothetical protein